MTPFKKGGGVDELKIPTVNNLVRAGFHLFVRSEIAERGRRLTYRQRLLKFQLFSRVSGERKSFKHNRNMK